MPILYLITAIMGGLLARTLYPGAIHIAPAAAILLGVPGTHLARLAGGVFHPWNSQRLSPTASLAYATMGALLLMSLGQAALNLFR